VSQATSPNKLRITNIKLSQINEEVKEVTSAPPILQPPAPRKKPKVPMVDAETQTDIVYISPQYLQNHDYMTPKKQMLTEAQNKYRHNQQAIILSPN